LVQDILRNNIKKIFYFEVFFQFILVILNGYFKLVNTRKGKNQMRIESTEKEKLEDIHFNIDIFYKTLRGVHEKSVMDSYDKIINNSDIIIHCDRYINSINYLLSILNVVKKNL
jgi:hypothetical protein